jgi:uroporphyrinogen decarboxylase
LKEDEKPFLSVMNGKVVARPPIWLMRQAGRYLPEYRALRAQAGSFWAMCMDPHLATEITLQPIRRFGFDAAIIFSDILTIPYALGRTVRFDEGKGPLLEPVNSASPLDHDPGAWRRKLEPAYETIRCVRRQLPAEIALLGFAGAPWTLATYLAAGRGGDDQRAAKLWGYCEPESFASLLALIGDCVAQHLVAQIEAGADAVQIFDSWAGGLPDEAYLRWVVQPTSRVVDIVRQTCPGAKIIGFPRASSLAGYELYAAETGVDGVSVDTGAPMRWLSDFARATIVQGNLDPVLLLTGGEAMQKAVAEILQQMRGKRFIFNLGHGVLPETPVEHVAELVRLVRAAQ